MNKIFRDLLTEMMVRDRDQDVLGRAHFANFEEIEHTGKREIYHIRKDPNEGHRTLGIRVINTRTPETS